MKWKLNRNLKLKKNNKNLIKVALRKRRKIENIEEINLDQDQGLEKEEDQDQEIKEEKIRNIEDDLFIIYLEWLYYS